MEERPIDSGADKTAQALSPEAELREKEAFNFALFQHNPLPTVVVDAEGQVLKSNLARRHSVQGLPELGAPLFDPRQGETEAQLHEALLACTRDGVFKQFRQRQLGEFFFAITMAPLPAGAIVITQDITEGKIAQEQLMQAHKMVALGTLVSGVAHEISNPNNILLLNAGYLKQLCNDVKDVLDSRREEQGEFMIGTQPYDEVRDELPQLVDGLERAAKRIAAIVKDLKNFASPQASELLPVSLNETVASALNLVAPMIKQATNRFEIEYGEGLPPFEGSPQRIEQVIVNLLTNACQALPDKHRALTVVTRSDAERMRAIVEVRDEGAGIEQAHLARIMDPFFTTRRTAGGTGLGLSICRSIVDSHRGTLTFDSVCGKGTTATLSLPALEKKTSAPTGKERIRA